MPRKEKDILAIRTPRERFRSNKYPELLNLVDTETLILRGKPSLMRGYMLLTNRSQNKLLIQEITFKHPKTLSGKGFPTHLSVNTCLESGSKLQSKVRIALPKSTPSGVYQTQLIFGDKLVDVIMRVTNNLHLQIFPNEFVSQGVVPMGTYEFDIEIINLGNMDYTIPSLNHSLILDNQYICKARSWALKNDSEKGIQGLLEGFVQRIANKHATWVNLSVAESGKILKAGDSMILHIKLQLPKEIDKNSSYVGEIESFGNEVIKFQLLA